MTLTSKYLKNKNLPLYKEATGKNTKQYVDLKIVTTSLLDSPTCLITFENNSLDDITFSNLDSIHIGRDPVIDMQLTTKKVDRKFDRNSLIPPTAGNFSD